MVRSFICLLFMVVFIELGVRSHDECTESRCGNHGIHFPFRLNGSQPNHCGYSSGFDLSCTNTKNSTLDLPIDLPIGVKLSIKEIDYKSQTIQVYSSDNCLAGTVKKLNLSSSIFKYKTKDPFGDITDISLFNCPTERKEIGNQIACLSNSTYHVYAVDGKIDELPLSSCTKMYEVLSVPVTIFREDILLLNWSQPACGPCEQQGESCRFKNNETYETECFKPTEGNKGSSAKILATGITLGVFLIIAMAVFAIYGRNASNRAEKEYQTKIEQFLKDHKALKPTRYSYADIKRITDQFKEKLGQGAFGTVFKGRLTSEILVAVKILNDTNGNGDEFINEVGTIGGIHHVNVVRLVGFCADGFRRALVYEFLPNESLEKFIFSVKNGSHSLGWEKLHEIAVGIAKGIEYLHQGCSQRILHFDIKPHNILLDQNFFPKISDFGLAKLCSKDQSVVSMSAARGTMGYIAPEVLSRNFGKVTYKSDVYSYGMLLLEMVGGRKNIDVTMENTSQVYFPEWIYNHLEQGEELHIRIEEEGDSKMAKKLAIIGLWCIQWYPSDRPSMKSVVQMLVGGEEHLTMPPNPFASGSSSAAIGRHPGRAIQRELPVIQESE